MNLWKAVTAALVRHLMTALAGWLAAEGIFDEELRAKFIVEGTPIIVAALLLFASTVGWSAWQKLKAKLKVLIARDLSPNTPLATIEKLADGLSLTDQVKKATSPGTLKVPIVLFLVGALLAGGCSHLAKIGARPEVTDAIATIYRSPERARLALTALQALRWRSAKTVAELYVSGHITKQQLQNFDAIDSEFRAKWAVASDLVSVWLTLPGAKPKEVDSRMSDVEKLSLDIETKARALQP